MGCRLNDLVKALYWRGARRGLSGPGLARLNVGQILGALAIGAVAVGAVAVGALAIGTLAVGRARIRRLEIDELVVRKLRLTEEWQVPSPGLGRQGK